MFRTQLQRELLLSFRSAHDLANPLLFFVMITSLLPLAVGADTDLLQKLAIGIVWVMALLASLLSLDQLFRSDYEDGSLDQLLLLPQGLFWPVMAKIFSHWLVSGLPLALVSPMLALMFNLPVDVYGALVLSLLLGTLYFSFVGAIGAALTVCLRKGGLLLSLIIMPLYIPVLIFGAGSVSQLLAGYNAAGPLGVLAALTAFSVALSPLMIVAALRIGVDG